LIAHKRLQLKRGDKVLYTLAAAVVDALMYCKNANFACHSNAKRFMIFLSLDAAILKARPPLSANNFIFLFATRKNSIVMILSHQQL